MHGSRRVVTFCLLTTVLPAILIMLPLYLRNSKYADVMYKISDSDVIQIHKGQSSIFCEKHSLEMNTAFNAFQMRGVPQISNKTKNIRLKKSMSLPDDTLEYWGFYLLQGATVELQACSRYEGAKILVVRGDRILNTCGILEKHKNKRDPSVLLDNQKNMFVTLEDPNNKYDNHKLIKNDNDLTEKYISDIVENEIMTNEKKRTKRTTKLHNPNTVLDTGVHHGGNAFNSTNSTKDESISSFENSLHDCYGDKRLMNNFFPYAADCNSTNYLENTRTLKVIYDVPLDGYYYYIFYSDNDLVHNDIHAIFDIYKPTFEYVNSSDDKNCINKTKCEFNVNFFSDELVIVEVPTKDGLQNVADDVSVLRSVCHPRVTIYAFFPICALLFVLIFAFL